MGNKVNSDLLKGLAIIAVVAIHSFSKTISSTPVNLFVDQLSRFAVPLFMALSGYGLTLSFSKNNNLIRFYVKRVWKILPWFLAASVLILIYKNYFERGTFDFFNYHTWTMIMRGGADYHLYFVPNILQLYLIFPLLFFLVKRFPKTALLLALLWQVYWYWRISTGTEVLGNHNQIWPDQMQYVALQTWILYFILGIYLAFKPMILASKYLLLIVIVGFVLTFANALILKSSGIDMLVATRFTRLPVILYATGIILLGLSLNSRFYILDSLGKYSFQIYLLHTIVLRILPSINPFILTPLVLLLTFALVKFILISINVFTRPAAIFLRRS